MSQRIPINILSFCNACRCIYTFVHQIFVWQGTNRHSERKHLLPQILTNSTLIEEPIRPAYQSSVQNFLGNMSLDLETETTRFTGALLPCHRLSSAVSITVQTFCANSAAIQGLGSNSLIAFAITFILLITFLCFQIFIQLHQKHCLHASNQGIPLYLFVRYIHKTKNE